MALQTIATLKNYFKTGLKPTQQQFWNLIDSLRHKSDKVAAADIDGLQTLLDAKVDKKDIAAPEVWDETKAYIYDADVQKYVSYENAGSANPQFQVEGFYRLLSTTTAGQSPETHPAKWAYQGQILGEVGIDDVVGLTERLNNIEAGLENNSGGGSAYLLSISTAPTYNADGTAKILKQAYISDPTKYFEQRFEYTAGLVSKIEIKDDIAAKWVRQTNIYNGNGQLQVPTITDISAWTIT